MNLLPNRLYRRVWNAERAMEAMPWWHRDRWLLRWYDTALAIAYAWERWWTRRRPAGYQRPLTTREREQQADHERLVAGALKS